MEIVYLTFNLSRLAGGLFYSVSNLARNVNSNKRAGKVSIIGMKDKFSIVDSYQYANCNPLYYSILPIFKRYGISIGMYNRLKKCHPAIIHQHGIWMFNSAVLFLYKKWHPKVKLIISPRGMMDPWILQRSRRLKRLVYYLWEKSNWSNCDCFHALCESEYNSIRKICKHTPIAIIPNGITIPDWKRDYSFKASKKKIVFISRIHEKKGLKELVEAIHIICTKNKALLNSYSFEIAGWGNKEFVDSLIQKVHDYELEDIIHFKGSLYKEDKDRLLKEAFAFILPSYSEGLPMAVLEAWAYGLPALITDDCNLPIGFETKSALKIHTDPAMLSEELTTILMMKDEELSKIGSNGYNLVKNKFSWETIAEQMNMLYEWTCGDIDKPDFIRYD